MANRVTVPFHQGTNCSNQDLVIGQVGGSGTAISYNPGFVIYDVYNSGNASSRYYRAGKLREGNDHSVRLPVEWPGLFCPNVGLAVALFHTHPGTYNNAGRPSYADTLNSRYLNIIQTHSGFLYGRREKR